MPGRSVDATHDPGRRSWVASANIPDTDFPIQNLPFGVFARGPADPGRVGVAIGDLIIDLTALRDENVVHGDAVPALEAAARPELNGVMALAARHRHALRTQLSDLLRADSPVERAPGFSDRVLVPAATATMRLPARVGDYTDFYASVHHATRVGALFRPDNPLLPNYKWVPIGYHGRASSIVVSGTPVRRPGGQTKPADAAEPSYGPTRALDYEAELGMFVGPGNAAGDPVAIDEAEDHLFGVCLVNDWSARDIQAWEYQPLGPFLAKNFATTISPWVVTWEALTPFRVPAPARPTGDPPPLPYLAPGTGAARAGLDLAIEVSITSKRMRDEGEGPARLSLSNARDLYWTPAQLLTHHTSNGCNLQSGDLLASGTVSGPTAEALGCLLEITRRGAAPITLPTGERRVFLEDGDEVTLRGYCARAGAARIGLGACSGVVGPARP